MADATASKMDEMTIGEWWKINFFPEHMDRQAHVMCRIMNDVNVIIVIIVPWVWKSYWISLSIFRYQESTSRKYMPVFRIRHLIDKEIIPIYRRVMCFRGSSVFVGSFPGAFSRTRDKISQLTHVYKHLPRVACCLIKMLSIKFRSMFAASFSRGSVGKQVLYLMTVSCHFSSPCFSGTNTKII